MVARAANLGEVRIQQYHGYSECDVIVVLRGREMIVRLPNRNQAVKWARMECKSYKISDEFLKKLLGTS